MADRRPGCDRDADGAPAVLDPALRSARPRAILILPERGGSTNEPTSSQSSSANSSSWAAHAAGLEPLSACGSGGCRWRMARNGLREIRGSSEATVRIPSVRGEIQDRNGVTLVQNRASYEVDFYLPEMVKGYRERFGQPPLTEYRARSMACRRIMKEPDIIKIVNDGRCAASGRPRSGAELQRRSTAASFPRRTPRSRSLTSRTSISRRWRSFPSTMSDCPVWISRSSRSDRMFTARSPRISSAMSARRTTRTRRRRRSSRFYQGDVEGKSNIEKSMDEYLRGKPGVRYLRRNAKGQIDGVLREEPPQAGRERYSNARRANSDDRRRGAACRRSRRRPWSLIRTTATFSPWSRCLRSIRTLLFQASRRKIGKLCKRMKPNPLD